MSRLEFSDITRRFTREEFATAHRFVMSAAEADEVAAPLYDSACDPGSTHIADGSLMLLALLSDDAARRVSLYEPRLAARFQHIRSDPERYHRHFLGESAEPELPALPEAIPPGWWRIPRKW